MKLDLDNLSLDELRDIQSQAVKAISSYKERKKKAALAQLDIKAQEMGFSLSELTGISGKSRKKSVGIPKYANPENPTETWTGRGRKPNWIVKLLAEGKSPEDLQI